MKYYFFRLSGTVEIGTNFAEEDIHARGKNGVGSLELTDEARNRFQREIRELLERGYNVQHLDLTAAEFERVEEEPA